MTHLCSHGTEDVFERAADGAARAIPPVWPLASSVAVNPFLGQAGEDLATTGARLARVAGVSVTMPRGWYQARIAEGRMSNEDLLAAWAQADPRFRPANLAALKAAAESEGPSPVALSTIADLAAKASGIDWPALIVERMGAWAASYFDEGQALWAGPRGRSAYAAWKAVATHDLTPEIAGLPGFALHVSEAPDAASALTARVAGTLGLTSGAMDTYFHQMLTTLGGWAQVARHRLWQAELGGGADSTVTDLLAIRLLWEEALFLRYEQQIGAAWADVRADHEAPVIPTSDLVINAILQEAADRAAQRALSDSLADGPEQHPTTRPRLQAAFCIDVRSEVFRRALENIDPEIQTLGFAGFFGLATAHRRFASDVEELRLPVLLNPGVRSRASDPTVVGDMSARIRSRAQRAWGRFKVAAVSSFAFVEAAGPLYIGKLAGDALGLKPKTQPRDPAPRFDPEPTFTDRVVMAETVLRAMSLTDRFAPIVLLVGHGARVVNNPHASALQCGACGGHSGEVNVRLLVQLLNNREVRRSLAEKGIDIPFHTLFVAALHDTTTDGVQLYDLERESPVSEDALTEARIWLFRAGVLARRERAQKLPGAKGGNLGRRSLDWSETRPEWGLAGCKAFIAAPRHRTAGRNLKGRVFLHEYDWRKDKGFGILELILTAPVVVASWISLQYYGSTVAPEVFGGGDKRLHNVTGGIGVVEGNGGLLRVGLPWQSIHDGTSYVHDPLRLTVCIEAPRQALTEILRRHPGVLSLFDNRWLHLFVLDGEGRMAWRYAGDLRWDRERGGEPDETCP